MILLMVYLNWNFLLCVVLSLILVGLSWKVIVDLFVEWDLFCIIFFWIGVWFM